IPLFVVMALALVLRRRKVWLAAVLILGLWVGGTLAHLDAVFGLGSLLVQTVIIFSVADRAPGWVAMIAPIVGVGLWWLGDLQITAPDFHQSLFADVVYALPVYGLASFAGWAKRRQRSLTKRLEATSMEVRQERERLAARAVAGERTRIAHELRALVLRGVETMTGQARMARGKVDAGSSAAARDIEAIEVTGRRTLLDMRRLLALLRRSDEEVDDGRALGEASSPTPEGASPATSRSISGLRRRVPAWLTRPAVVDVALALALA